MLIVRLLLGLVFFVFGLNAFLQFLKGPIPDGLAGQFLQALFQSHDGLAIGAVQAVGGALLLYVVRRGLYVVETTFSSKFEPHSLRQPIYHQ